MSDQPNQRDQARQQRLRAALRENLKRRKAQIRARSAEAAPDNEAAPAESAATSEER